MFATKSTSRRYRRGEGRRESDSKVDENLYGQKKRVKNEMKIY